MEPKQTRFFSGISVLAFLLLFMALFTGSAGFAYGQLSINGHAKVIGPAGYSELQAKIAAAGSVRIIVTVEMPFVPFADPLSKDTQEQVSRIKNLQDVLLTELSPYNITDIYKFTYIPQLVMTVNGSALRALLMSNLVRSVQEDVAVPVNLDLSVPRIGAPSVWTAGYKGAGIAVAILDTGVDKNHAFISGKTVSEACYSSNVPSYESSSICPDSVTESTAVGSALPYAGNCPAGECDHGTHVAGIAAGKESISGSPGPGVAPLADIIAVQVFSRFDSASQCSPSPAPCVLSYTSDQIKGLQRIYALRSSYTIASVNMSLGGGQYSSPCDADSRKPIIDSLKAAGIATVISSGNSGYCGSTGTPGCISTAITVGSTTDADAVASYSNSASFVDVLAPGSSINSSIPGGGYQSWNGTSMAAPHVTGAWALLKQARPGDTVDQILESLTSTGLSVTDGKCNSVTKQRINVFEALNAGTLPAPILDPEASVTPGTDNTIYWSEVSAIADMPMIGKPQPSVQDSSLSQSLRVTDTIQDTTTNKTLDTGHNVPRYPLRPVSGTLRKGAQFSQAQATLSLESVFVPSLGEGGKVLSASEPLAATTVFSETFEGAFPGSDWTLYGSPTWDDTSYDKHGGSWSGWCGDSTLNPANGYTDNMNAWTVYGPFSLADATTADLDFWYKNYSESGYDYFLWLASVNGTNFYGYQISGDQNSWRSQNFDLTNVPTLGNLAGQSQVWIAFLFTSDGSVSGPTYTGAYIDDVTITKDSAATPDLTPYQKSGWNDKIPVGITQLPGTDPHSYSGDYYDDQTLYVNWACSNEGSATASGYTVHFEVTGDGGSSWDWTGLNTDAGYHTYLTNDQPVGPLSAGSHTLKVWCDYTGAVSESNETNNYYERTISVLPVLVEYYAESADNSYFSSPSNSGWITQTQWTFQNLTPGQTYWYRVKARNGTEESAWSNVEYSQQECTDTTPDVFTFTDQTNVELNTTVTSNTITVNGICTAAPISITGCTSSSCQYSINGGAYTSSAGTVSNGSTVTVRQTSSGNYSTTTNATLTIGGVNDTFSVTTSCGLNTYYRDFDVDGYGDPFDSTQACTQPAGYVTNNTDCNDSNPAVHPGATETCNNIDDDCDGPADEDFTDLGDPCSAGTGVCEAGGNMVCKADGNGTECNALPGDPMEDPEGTCDDGLDNDCDSLTDTLDPTNCYPQDYYCDGDGDGHADHLSDGTCRGNECQDITCQFVEGDDCDDNNFDIWDCNTPVTDDPVTIIDGYGNSVTFSRILQGGDTSIITDNCLTEQVEGIILTDTTICANITTDATFDGIVEVCLTYDDTDMTQLDEEILRMIRCDEEGNCELLTESKPNDTENNVVCGLTDYFSIFAVGIPLDTDNDSVFDLEDNCSQTPNPGQEDTDIDGYGNICDADLDNDGAVGFQDFNIFKAAWLSDPSKPNWNPDADFDSDDAVGFQDFNIFKGRWLTSEPWE